MKKTTRRGVFETNSSSTHSICIPKIITMAPPKCIYFRFDEYGWEDREVDEPATYLHTAIHYIEKNVEERIAHLKEVLDKHGIEYEFARPNKDSWSPCGYVDHASELECLIQDLMTDEDKLLRYLIAGIIYTGSDNSSEGDALCYSACNTMWDFDEGREVPNPNHDPEHYEYYFKGN